MKINDLIDQYEQGAKLRGLAPTQLNALKPIRRGFGGMKVRGVEPMAVNAYVQSRRAGLFTEAHAKKPAADATIRRELGALSAVLNWSHERGILKAKPPKIDLPPASPPREVFLEKHEADMLWDRATQWAVKRDSTGLFVMLALDTWARAESIETLRWNRVDFERGLIDYREPGRPETKKRRMVVPMSTRLREALHAEYTARTAGGTYDPKDDLVAGPVTQYQWQNFKNWANARRDLTRHDLRRTGISLALARGVEPLKVAMMAGDDLATIMKHYARFAPDYLSGVVE